MHVLFAGLQRQASQFLGDNKRHQTRTLTAGSITPRCAESVITRFALRYALFPCSCGFYTSSVAQTHTSPHHLRLCTAPHRLQARPPACDHSRSHVFPERLPPAGEPSSEAGEPLPQAARAQPGRLVPLGRGGVRARPSGEQADFPVYRLFNLPLVRRTGFTLFAGTAPQIFTRQHLLNLRSSPGNHQDQSAALRLAPGAT